MPFLEFLCPYNLSAMGQFCSRIFANEKIENFYQNFETRQCNFIDFSVIVSVFGTLFTKYIIFVNFQVAMNFLP